MNRNSLRVSCVVVFWISLLCISLELFQTRILNLKAWNHVVYTIIPFAMLGYGIGANLVFIFSAQLKKINFEKLLALLLLATAFSSLATAYWIKDLPLNVEYITTIFSNVKSVGMLLLAYSVFMIPFIIIGFMIVHIFMHSPAHTHRLYFWDLLGAGAGAFLFFILINHLAVFHSLMLLACISVLTALWIWRPKFHLVLSAASILIFLGALTFLPEPSHYAIDPNKGWKLIPGTYDSKDCEQLVSRWHPLGRTDIFWVKSDAARERMFASNRGTFEINVDPAPDVAYISTNFLAGSPIYDLSPSGIAKRNSTLKLFSQDMEVAYTLVKDPKVVIIGAGGGRDIFMARSHGATNILGAEINPGIYNEMMPGGKMYDFSGRVYTSPNSKIYNIDGRNLIKSLPSASQDIVILNGVDTFSGLSSGAYAYAESYLYTQEAVEDYLRVLNDKGILNVYRWTFDDMPREELRLHAIVIAALDKMGIKNPEDHIMIGLAGWSIFLVRKEPFTLQERNMVFDYFKHHRVVPAFPAEEWLKKSGSLGLVFDDYAQLFKQHRQHLLEEAYKYDISVVNDDKPFFYKYYKLNLFNPFKPVAYHYTGTVIFFTQGMIFLEALIFITLFVFLPLVVFKKDGVAALPKNRLKPFITYFACLGIGYMFIEIALMQRFTILLGSPIYSISLVLAVLLVASGLGSFAIPWFDKISKNDHQQLIQWVTGVMVVYVLGLVILGTRVFDMFMPLNVAWRMFIVAVLTFPLGFLLGVYFPYGLRASSAHHAGTIPWGWGINCGFSVLGSIAVIMIAQFQGFNNVLILSCVIYLIAALAFKRLAQSGAGS